MGLTHSPRIATDGLLFCVDAANARSYPGTGTTWTDLVGGNNGTLTNMDASNYSNDNRGALSFDGSDELVTTNYNVGPTNYSIECIFSSDNTAASSSIIFGRGTLASQVGVTILINGGTLFFWVNGTAGEFQKTYSADEVIHFIVNSDGAACINGEIENISWTNHPNTVTWPSSSNYFFMGGTPETPFLKLSGKIFISRLYNKSSTNDEMRQNYLATKGRYG